jgi:3-methyladenine DNA glycosylase AlkD
MDLAEVMKALEAAGSAQTRKTYTRHGVTGPQFGVSAATTKVLTKKIKTDHALAGQLWDTGNHDARILALFIADPSAATVKQIDEWAKALDNYVLTGALAEFIARTPHARKVADKWESKTGWLRYAAWTVLGRLCMSDPDIPDEYFEKRLEYIEREIHKHKDRFGHGLNQALICIGIRNPRLTELALAAAGRIGKVEVDHGDTACKTPDAAAYIRKTLAHQEKRGKRVGC